MSNVATTWENMHVTITSTFGEGGRINFDDAPIQKPRFRLRGVYLPRPSGGPVLSRYAVDFDQGYMVAWWSGVQVFPLGSEVANLQGALPPFDNSVKAQRAYADTLAPIRAELNKFNTNLARLEGYMGVLYPDVPRVDRVQMTYLPSAVRQADGTQTDLVYVQFNFADASGIIQPLENGGGTGPPN